MTRLSSVALLATLAAAPPAAAPPSRPAPTGALGDSTVVPLRTVEFAGHRYVADVELGLGEPVPLMIHGNARMFLAITHAVGERLTGAPVAKVEEYGYSRKGKGFVTVRAMRIGGRTYGDRQNVPVFDFTEDGDTLVQGMLGVPFLVSADAVVDFSRDALILGATPTNRPSKALLAAGYTAAAFTITPNQRVTLPVSFPALGRSIAITPSTVSSALTLDRPLFAGKVPMRPDATPDQSPSRTSPALYEGDRVDFEIAGVKLHAPATFEDFAEYGAVPSSEIETFGMLGFDWMKEHRAIIDYGSRYLYFMP